VRASLTAAVLLLLAACTSTLPRHDVVIRNATIYDGSGVEPLRGDVAIDGDRIAAVGVVAGKAKTEIDAHGHAVAPGFINVMSQADGSLMLDGRGLSDLLQGVTTEIFGEGESPGPLSPAMKKEALASMTPEYRYDINWTTLRQFLDQLVRRGVSPNVASFIGAATPRVYVMGRANRAPTAAELDEMRGVVRQAMDEGAIGIASALIYAPGAYASTDELIALSKVAGERGGIYISHMRSEGDRLLEAVDELITISREAKLPAQIYHLKAAGEANWPKLDAVIERVNAARAQGLDITADMYTYTAGATGLDAAMPPWVQAGGYDEWRKRLRDPETRAKVLAEMRSPATTWESLLRLAGSPDRVLFLSFKNPQLRQYTGKTLAEVSKARGTSPEDTAIDLVIEDGSRVETAYFLMSEENVRKQIRQPWMTFGSDAAAIAPEGVFLKSSAHPRTYGNFVNLLGKYARDEHVIPLQEAVRRMTTLAASTMHITERGALKPGYFADVVVFDPDRVNARSTYAQPHQLATGVEQVFVNGVQVVRDGAHTEAKPGRVVVRSR
jgi:N-acyl-D-amino-acid deacylase